MIYLDNSATTALSENVKNDIIKNLENFGNPSSIYELGFLSNNIISNARQTVADCIGADFKQIYFTSGASESNSWVLNNFDKIFLPTPIEHHSILNNPKIVSEYSNDCLISQMLVNNEIGIINDIKSLHNKYPNSPIHTDATQAIGNINVNVKDLQVNFMSFSGHKFHAPKGIGVLYSDRELKPLIYGGKQEFGYRGGTENVIGISALGVAIKDAYDNINKKNEHCAKLKDYMIKRLADLGVDFILNAKEYNTINSVLSLSFKGIESESMVIRLNLKDICCSSGSACNTGSLEPSETLKWLDIPKEYINGTLRFSFDMNNTIDEIEYVCNQIKGVL